MARIIEEEPTERVVVHERDHDHIHEAPRSNTALIVGIIIVILLLVLLFGRGLLGGSSSSGGGTDINITPPTSKTGQ